MRPEDVEGPTVGGSWTWWPSVARRTTLWSTWTGGSGLRQDVVALAVLQRQPVHERLGDGLDGEWLVIVANTVDPSVGGREAEPSRSGSAFASFGM